MTVPSNSWRSTTLGAIATSVRNGLFKARPTDDPTGSRILRISAVRPSGLDLTAAKFVAGVDESEVSKYSLHEGDLLLTRYNGSRHLVGLAARVPAEPGVLLYPDKLIRVVIDRSMALPEFVNYQLASPSVRGFLEPRIRTTAGQSGISGVDVKAIPIILPTLEDQRRVVELLDDHFSRLDAADARLDAVSRRLSVLQREVAIAELTGGSRGGGAALPAVGVDDGVMPALPGGWRWARLGDVADVVGGVTKDARKQGSPDLVEVPYLRVANVQRGRLQLDPMSTIRVPASKAEALRLRSGDVLLNEGGDRNKLGRGWVWEQQIENCIHQNHVFRARVRGDVIDPYLLSWAGNTIGGPWCERNGKQSVNLASISLSKIRLMPIPIPPADEQPGIRKRIDNTAEACARAENAVEAGRKRSAALRRGLLEAAFAGRLIEGVATGS